MDARFALLSKTFVNEYPALSPVGATGLGDHRFDGKLDEISAEARQREREFYQHWLKQLASFDRSQLSRAHQVDLSLLKKKLERELWSLNELQEWAWNPIEFTQTAGQSIYGLMSREFAPVEMRLTNVAARLEQFPRFYQQIRETLEPARVPQIHAETAIKQNRGVLKIIENMVLPQIDKLDEATQTRLKQAILIATEAVEEHQTWLVKELLPNAKGNFRLGPELFDEKLKHSLNGSFTRQELRERAEYELKRTRAEMYQLARQVLTGNNNLELPEVPTDDQQQAGIEAGLELAYEQLPPRDGIVAAAEKSMVITTDFIRKHKIMTIPDDPLEIILMPEFQRGVSVAYCDSPGALEVGQQTYYAVAPLPESWSDEQCTSFLREYNILSIHNLTVHEAMPGHFVQLAYSNRYPSKLRSLLSSGTFIEGWACYTEQMMSEEGFMNRDPLMRLVTLKWYLRTIANVILDQSMHVDGIRREEAMKLMTRDTFQQESEASGKWIRSQVTAAQLSTYFVGVQEHRDMRETVEKSWGNEFTLQKYHDAVVLHGSPPVKYVKAILLDEAIPE